MSILVIGDTHLEGWANILPEDDHVQIQLYNLSAILTDAKDQFGTKTAIFLGDIFDNQEPIPESIYALHNFICSDIGRQYDFYFECGNHDSENKYKNSLLITTGLSKLKVLPNLQVFSKKTRDVTIEGIPWRFIPWPGFVKETEEEPMVIVTHNDYKGMTRDNGTEENTGRKLKPGRNLVVTGHYHRMQKGNRWFNPGTPYQRTFGEPLPKGYGILDIKRNKDGSLEWETKFVERTPSHRLYTKNITAVEDFDKLKASSSILYKLRIPREVKIGLNPNWQRDLRERGVRLTDFEYKGERERVVVDVSEIPDIDDPLSLLMSALKKSGHSKESRNKVRSILGG